MLPNDWKSNLVIRRYIAINVILFCVATFSYIPHQNKARLMTVSSRVKDQGELHPAAWIIK